MRLVVRTTPEFWVALDAAMQAGREPSWHDFAAVELVGIEIDVNGPEPALDPADDRDDG